MKLNELVSFLDERLKVSEWREKDNGANGLQLVGKPEVKKVALAVDACEYTIKQAIKEKADMLITHHGIFYGKSNLFSPTICNRFKLALGANLSIYSAHLSLDAAEGIGNSDQMLKRIGAKKKGRFWDNIGAYGSIKTTRNKLKQKLSEIVGCEPTVFALGPEKIRSVAVATGSGANAIYYLPTEGVDALITGVCDDGIKETAKEMQVNVFFGGHIATEEFGLKALSNILRKKGLKTFFIIPHR